MSTTKDASTEQRQTAQPLLAHGQEAAAPPLAAPPIGAQRWVLLGSLVGGHGVVHWFETAFPVLLAEIVRDLGLGPAAAGGIMGIRSLASGAINFPAGFISDTLGQWRALILVLSLVLTGLAYFLVGIAPTYGLLILAVALLGIGAAGWHPPALATLFQRFPERRGFVAALHGAGAIIGDIVGPLTMGALLGLMAWQTAAQAGTLPALILAAVLWLLLQNTMTAEAGRRGSVAEYLGGVREAIRNVPFLAVVVASGLRSAGHVTLLTFFPIYLREDLGFSPPLVGGYVALISGLGLVSQPVLGFLSDRFGRKAVVVPGLTTIGLLTAVLPWSGSGLGLTVVVAAMGVFVFSLSAILLAQGTDIIGEGVQATGVGALFVANFGVAAVAPVVAGYLAAFFGIQAAFYTVAALFLVGALVIAPLPGGGPGPDPPFEEASRTIKGG